MLAVYHITVLNNSRLIVPSQYTIRLQAGGQEREGKWVKLDPVPTVKFILKLHPEEKNKNKTMTFHVCIIDCTLELTAVIPV